MWQFRNHVMLCFVPSLHWQINSTALGGKLEEHISQSWPGKIMIPMHCFLAKGHLVQILYGDNVGNLVKLTE
uniref:Uncharacterized protein n=1 Tax=Arundo donax TaxID=35708 RepID=A0A0A8ZRZ1_ARUDO